MINKIKNIFGFGNPIINYTITESGVDLIMDNKNSGEDLIMPKLTDSVLNKIIHDNKLFKIDDNNPTLSSEDLNDFNKDFITIYLSRIYPETVVIITDSKERYHNFYFKGRIQISSFIKLDIPKRFDFDIRNRSGNFKRNINVVTGLIDNPYTGEMGLQINTIHYSITKIDFANNVINSRYAQIVIKKVYKRNFNFVNLFDFMKLKSVIKKDKIRGVNGFGSTGK